MAVRYIPFDEVVARCLEDVPGEDFSDETEGQLSDHSESESVDDVGEEENLSSSNFEDSDSESDSYGTYYPTDFTAYFCHGMVFLCFSAWSL